jgi:hypothetical protein
MSNVKKYWNRNANIAKLFLLFVIACTGMGLMSWKLGLFTAAAGLALIGWIGFFFSTLIWEEKETELEAQKRRLDGLKDQFDTELARIAVLERAAYTEDIADEEAQRLNRAGMGEAQITDSEKYALEFCTLYGFASEKLGLKLRDIAAYYPPEDEDEAA